MRGLSVIVGLLLASASAMASEPPKVLVSLAPLHSLAASVMKGAATPELLMPASASPHDFSLKPSDAKRIQNADLVLWVGPQMESFLSKPLVGLKDKQRLLTVSELPGMLLLEPREGGPWEVHADGHGHGEQEQDGHLWLDIGNAKLLAGALAERLSSLDPAHGALYRQNAAELSARLDRLDRELKDRLAPLAGKPYVVYHDAFQYFEKRYGLAPAGSITLEERAPSAKTVARLRAKIAKLKAACVFKEPQAPEKPVLMVAEGLNVKIGSLDDLGATLTPGMQLYEDLLKGAAASLADCLN
jgi:zinc transport system substrate-binding protein